MITVLRIVQNATTEMAIAYPTALVGIGDTDTQQLLALIYCLTKELRNERIFPQQKKTYSFDLTVGRVNYPLPIDFYSPCFKTHLNVDAQRGLNGPVPDYDFTVMRNLGINRNYDSQYSYRIFGLDAGQYTAGGQFQIYPTPTATDTVSFEYITRNVFLPKFWAPSTAYTSGTYVSANGNIYLCDTSGTSDATTAPTGTTQNIVDGTTRWDYQNALYEAIIADTDVCIFDYDIMVAGLKAKYLEAREFPSAAAAMASYKKLLDRAKSRFHGSTIGSFSRRNYGRRYRPATDGGWNL